MLKATKRILESGIPKTFDKGKTLFAAGEPANAFYYVQTGEIRVFKMNEKGSEVEVKRFGPGNFLGEVILFSSDVFPVSAEASKKSQVLYFPKATVIREILQDSSLALLFLKILSQKCIALNQRLETLSLQNIRKRLTRYLIKECPPRPPYSFELKSKKTEIAKELGTISETLSRNLRQLQKDKLIRVNGRQVQILNYTALDREAK